MDKYNPVVVGTCEDCGCKVLRVSSGRPDRLYEYYCSSQVGCRRRIGEHVTEEQEENRENHLLWVSFGVLSPLQVIQKLQSREYLIAHILDIWEIQISHKNFEALCAQMGIPVVNPDVGVYSRPVIRGIPVVVAQDGINNDTMATILLKVIMPKMPNNFKGIENDEGRGEIEEG